MDWSVIKGLTLPNGLIVKKVARNGVTLWDKQTEPIYEYITPRDTNKFPATLTGYAYEELHGLASGRSTSYVGSVYAKPWLNHPAVKLGRAYSEIGNSVSSFDDYQYGDIAIGYSADSATNGNQALNVWISDHSITAAAGNALIEAANAHILYELFESDGSIWRAVVRTSDSATGYRNEVTGVFMQPKGGIPYGSPTDKYVLYDNGYIDGVEWSGNRLPHRDYYNASVCSCDFSHAASDDGGYIRLALNGSYSLQYNTHVCASAAVRVPDDATVMKVEAAKGVYQIDMRFGLMPENCKNSLDTSNGGVLSSTEYISASGKQTYTLNLPAGFAGGSWVPVVNAFEAANQLRELQIYKIWFE